MYDHNVGEFCTITTCKQKDWLPVKCKYCLKYFCAQHSSIQSHNCQQHKKQKKQVYICPLCNKVIQVNPHISVQDNFSIHQALDCSKDYKQKQIPKCGVKKCKTKIFSHNEFICKRCRRKFCLKHRMEDDHDCLK